MAGDPTIPIVGGPLVSTFFPTSSQNGGGQVGGPSQGGHGVVATGGGGGGQGQGLMDCSLIQPELLLWWIQVLSLSNILLNAIILTSDLYYDNQNVLSGQVVLSWDRSQPRIKMQCDLFFLIIYQMIAII